LLVFDRNSLFYTRFASWHRGLLGEIVLLTYKSRWLRHGLPHSHSPIMARRHDLLAVRAELRTLYPTAICGFLQYLLAVPRCRAPHSCSIVLAHRHNLLAIQAELRTIHLTSMPRQCLLAHPRRHAPHSHSLVPARRHKCGGAFAEHVHVRTHAYD